MDSGKQDRVMVSGIRTSQAVEIELVKDVQTCHNEKWDQLWEPYKNHRIPGWVRQMVSKNDVRDIELFIGDCIHHVYSRMFFALKDRRPGKRPINPKTFGGYVRQSVHNYVVSVGRSSSNNTGPFPKEEIPDPQPLPPEEIELDDLLKQIRKQILVDDDFNATERKIIIGCRLIGDEERVERKEMAERLGVPRHYVDNTLRKFSKKYRNKVFALIK